MPKNILITNLSIMTNSNEKEYYLDKNSDSTVKGIQTNEAPTKLLLRELTTKNQTLDQILALTSKKVEEPIALEGFNDKTHLSYYKEAIQKYAREKLSIHFTDDQFSTVQIVDNPSEQEVLESLLNVKRVLEELYEEPKEKETLHVYVESNGGIRYVLNMLLTILNLMEQQGKIKVMGIFAMVYDTPTPKIAVKNVQDIYDTIDLLSAVDEFINYGRTRMLHNYFSERVRKMSDEKTGSLIMNTIDEFAFFADNLQLCRTNLVLEQLSKTSEKLGEHRTLPEAIAHYHQEKGNAANSEMLLFDTVVGLIEEEFKPLFKQDSSKNLPQVIRWCINKDYVQQAATFCSESLPKYFLEQGILKIPDDIQKYQISMQQHDKNRSKYDSYYDTWITFLTKNYLELKRKFFNYYFMKLVAKQLDIPGLTGIEIAEPTADNAFSELHPDIQNSIQNRMEKEFERYYEIYKDKCDEKIAKKVICINQFHCLYQESFLNTAEEYERVIQDSYGCLLELLGETNKKNTFRVSNKYNPNLIQMFQDRRDERMYVNAILDNYKFRTELTEACDFVTRLPAKPYLQYLYEKVCQLDQWDSIKDKWENAVSKFQSYDSRLDSIITSDYSREEFHSLAILYGFIKQQRNFSNHANVADQDIRVALQVEQLKRIIEELLSVINKPKESTEHV